MKTYKYSYQSIVRFEYPITKHYFSLRCMPADCAFQRVVEASLFVKPESSVTHGYDAYGNKIQYGNTKDHHDVFMFASDGVVQQEYYNLPDENISPIYRLNGPLTTESPELKDFALSFENSDAGVVKKALAIAAGVNGYMKYVPGSTDNCTTAAAAFERGMGVCQDYAHILIVACRLNKIPARYVNGFMLGTGYTHAWVEIYDGKSWQGIDPTNNKHLDYGYIKVAHAQDAAGCPVNRGIFVMAGQSGFQESEIRLMVEEISDCQI